jgi:hypothetical protein
LQKDSNLIPHQQKRSQAKSDQEIKWKALWKRKENSKIPTIQTNEFKILQFFPLMIRWKKLKDVYLNDEVSWDFHFSLFCYFSGFSFLFFSFRFFSKWQPDLVVPALFL